MKDPAGAVRTWIYGVLNGTITYGGVTIPVYSFAPKDPTASYILLGSQTSDPENGTKDKWIGVHSIQVEIYYMSTGNDASYIPLNTISSSILALIRTRAQVTLDSNYKVISVTSAGLVTDNILTDTNIILYKSILLNLEIQEL